MHLYVSCKERKEFVTLWGETDEVVWQVYIAVPKISLHSPHKLATQHPKTLTSPPFAEKAFALFYRRIRYLESHALGAEDS